MRPLRPVPRRAAPTRDPADGPQQPASQFETGESGMFVCSVRRQRNRGRTYARTENRVGVRAQTLGPCFRVLAMRRPVNSKCEGSLGSSKGLVVFFVQRKAVEYGLHARVLSEIESSGFSILAKKTLSTLEVERLGRHVREGKVVRSPSCVIGDEPLIAVAAHDLIPVPPTPGMQRKYPGLDNARILVKRKIQHHLADCKADGALGDAVHSSNNHLEALAYLNAAMPNRLEAILNDAYRLERDFHSDGPVFGTLTKYGARAKVEVVDFHGERAVKKTFRPDRERYLHREIHALKLLGNELPEIPPIWDCGPNYLVLPYYEDMFQFDRESPGLVPIAVARQAIGVLRSLFDRGYAHLDFSFQNVVIDRNNGFKVIDFEFLHRYEERPATFEQSYDIVGPPVTFRGDVPRGRPRTYEVMFEPHVGLTLEALLEGDPCTQKRLRAQYTLTKKWPEFLSTRAHQSARRLYRMFSAPSSVP